MAKTNVRLAMADTARELSAVLKNRNLYEKVIREAHWMEGPITIVGSGVSRVAGLAAARVLEWLLGWPAAARDPAEFASYILSTLRPRSVLIAVSPSGEEEDLLEVVRRAQRQGVSALAFTRNPESELVRMARGACLLSCAEEASPPVRTAFLEQATLTYIACIAASVFNPRHPLAGTWEEEFGSLPARLEWVQEHLGDAVKSAAEALKQAGHNVLTGGGLYYPSALQAARLAWQISSGRVQAVELHDLINGALGAEAGVALILSGSACKVKKRVYALAARLREKNAQIFSITDNNDRQLAKLSNLAILLPVLSEVTGSLLALAVLQWLIAESSG
jgi:D-arabinose 5-phosphate isomerase GutQ